MLGGATLTDEVWPGYRLSVASYVCSLFDPRIVAELGLRAHGYDVYRKDPASFTPLADGRSLLLGGDEAANAREVAAFDQRDVAGLAAFEREATRLGGLLADSFDDPEPSFEKFPADVQATLRGSAAELVERYVRTPVLAATLATDGLIGTEAGPRDPGTAYVLAHHYAGRALGAQGTWGFVRGGMGAIASALAAAAARGGRRAAHGRRGGPHRAARRPRRAARAGRRRDRRGRRDPGQRRPQDALPAPARPRPTCPTRCWRGPAPGAPTGSRSSSTWRWGSCPTSAPGPATTRSSRTTAPPSTSRPTSTTCKPRTTTAGRWAPRAHRCWSASCSRRPTRRMVPPGKHVMSIFAQYFPYERPDRPWLPADRERSPTCWSRRWPATRPTCRRDRAPPGAGRARHRGADRHQRRPDLPRRAAARADLRAPLRHPHRDRGLVPVRLGRPPGRLRQRLPRPARGGGGAGRPAKARFLRLLPKDRHHEIDRLARGAGRDRPRQHRRRARPPTRPWRVVACTPRWRRTGSWSSSTPSAARASPAPPR